MGLNINHNILAKRNHKFFLFQKNHHFINKLITIVAEDRGTNGIFEAAGAAAGYVWNSLPIIWTNILHSVPNIGRKLPFPLDFDSSILPAVVSNNAEFVVSYLRLIDSSRYFASAILKIFVKDRRTIHAERFDNSSKVVTMDPGDITMACTAVYSFKSTDKVAKLWYIVRGPFQMIRGKIHGRYIVW